MSRNGRKLAIDVSPWVFISLASYFARFFRRHGAVILVSTSLTVLLDQQAFSMSVTLLELAYSLR